MKRLLIRLRYIIAHMITGYGEIELRSQGDDLIVSVVIRGRKVDVIREYGKVDGSISHTVTSIGIRDEWERVRGGYCDKVTFKPEDSYFSYPVRFKEPPILFYNESAGTDEDKEDNEL
jgi:hypothetical protein